MEKCTNYVKVVIADTRSIAAGSCNKSVAVFSFEKNHSSLGLNALIFWWTKGWIEVSGNALQDQNNTWAVWLFSM